MPVTIYNPTTGRYVTSQSVSSNAKKTTSPAALKSKVGGQAAPLKPTGSSVKVQLSNVAQSVLAGTTKLKVSELVAKFQDPKYSPADISGVTLYVNSSFSELMPPAVSTQDYKNILNLLTAQGGRKLMDVRANNDVPVKLDVATFTQLQTDMTDATLAKAGASTVHETLITPSTQGTAPITLTGNPADVVKWYVPGSTVGSWTEVTDPSLPSRIDATGTLSTTVAAMPAALMNATQIKAEVHSSALLGVASNVSLDLATGSNGVIADGVDPAILARFKQMVAANKITRVSFDGQTGPVTLTPDAVSSLGAKMVARYPGKITIDASAQSLLSQANWESMRLLNNYRDVAINLNTGIPASKTPISALSQATSHLSYAQFIGGYNLLGSISVANASAALEPTTYDATAKTQKALVSGLLSNGDSMQISLATSGGARVPLSVGPLALPKGASAEQQASALVSSLNTALANNSSFAGVSVARTGNELTFTWSGAAPTQTPPFAFVSATRASDTAPTFGVELTDVPPSAAQSLTTYPQIYDLNVKGSADQLFMNSDKLNGLISNGYVKTIQLTDTGNVRIGAGQALRSIPMLQKIGGGKIVISDYPTSPSSYANFTNAAADSLAGGIRIVASPSQILDSLSGLTALARMGKISTLTVTGSNGRQTVIDNLDSSKLSELVGTLRQGG